jgi:hypothetical protein
MALKRFAGRHVTKADPSTQAPLQFRDRGLRRGPICGADAPAHCRFAFWKMVPDWRTGVMHAAKP